MTIAAKAVIAQPEMNRTEEKYAWVLEHRKLAGEILFYEFGVITLRIGNDCRIGRAPLRDFTHHSG